MASGRTYLDYNASAPLLPEARSAMCAAIDLPGNPSSVHAEGRRLRSLIEAAREDVARLVNAAPAEVVFTSGATEANVATLTAGFDLAYRSPTEHDSVLAPLAALGARAVDLPLAADGVVDTGAWQRMLEARRVDAASAARAVVAVQLANNETGIIQPVAEIAAIARAAGLHVHCDAVQAPGRVAVDHKALGADTLVLSAHKIGGPKGIGALVIRAGVRLPPLLTGGGQERRRRAGTENVPAIAGFGAAARQALAAIEEAARLAALRDRLEAGVLELTPAAVVIGAGAPRLANTSCLGLPGQAAEILVIRLDLAGIAVSAGAACSSGKVGTSHVLAAMGVDRDVALGAIRVSLGPASTADDIGRFLSAWREISLGAGRAGSGDEGRRNAVQVTSRDRMTSERDEIGATPSGG